jgi:DNA polymerase III epsilon subunit-like protein
VCIEVAVALYSVEYAAVIRSYSSLIKHDSNEADHVNRIPVGLLVDAPEASNVWAGVARFAMRADAIVAYGAEFDRRFVPANIANELPFICAMDDLQYPRADKRMTLTALALAHDVGVASAHRAFADVDLLARLFTRVHGMGVDIEAMLRRGLRPKARFTVAERGFDEARNVLVKAAGFVWDASRKEWSRSMALEDAETLPFRVERVDQ